MTAQKKESFEHPLEFSRLKNAVSDSISFVNQILDIKVTT